MTTCFIVTVDKSIYVDGYILTVGVLVSGKPDFCVVAAELRILKANQERDQIGRAQAEDSDEEL